MKGRRLELAALLVGLAFSLSGLAVGPLVWPLFAHLPHDPQAFGADPSRAAASDSPLAC